MHPVPILNSEADKNKELKNREQPEGGWERQQRPHGEGLRTLPIVETLTIHACADAKYGKGRDGSLPGHEIESIHHEVLILTTR